MNGKVYYTVTPNMTAALATDPTGFKAHKYMEMLNEGLQTDTTGLIEKIKGVYGFKVKNGPGGAEGLWIINAKEGKGKIEFNSSEKPEVTFTVSDEDLPDLISGKMNPQKAFLQRKIQLQGNMGLAMKLGELQKNEQLNKRMEELRAKL